MPGGADPTGSVEIETVGDSPQLPFPGNDPNGIYSAYWIKPSKLELGNFKDREQGYILVTDQISTVVVDCDTEEEISKGESNHQRRYSFEALRFDDVEGFEGQVFFVPSQSAEREVPVGQANHKWQYHQAFNLGLKPDSCTRGRVTIKSVIKVFKSSLFVGNKYRDGEDRFVSPYLDGAARPEQIQVPGEQIDEIGKVNLGDPIPGGRKPLGQATVRYQGRWNCKGAPEIAFHTVTNDLAEGEPNAESIDVGPNRDSE